MQHTCSKRGREGGGGVKGRLNNVQKNCTIGKWWLPLAETSCEKHHLHIALLPLKAPPASYPVHPRLMQTRERGACNFAVWRFPQIYCLSIRAPMHLISGQLEVEAGVVQQQRRRTGGNSWSAFPSLASLRYSQVSLSTSCLSPNSTLHQPRSPTRQLSPSEMVHISFWNGVRILW